jgi:hypothetical protein
MANAALSRSLFKAVMVVVVATAWVTSSTIFEELADRVVRLFAHFEREAKTVWALTSQPEDLPPPHSTPMPRCPDAPVLRSGWWRGDRAGKICLRFPSNFVEEIQLDRIGESNKSDQENILGDMEQGRFSVTNVTFTYLKGVKCSDEDPSRQFLVGGAIVHCFWLVCGTSVTRLLQGGRSCPKSCTTRRPSEFGVQLRLGLERLCTFGL